MKNEIHRFHVAMIKGSTHTNLAISISPCGIQAFFCEYSQKIPRILQALMEIAKLVYIKPFIIATWKW